MERSIRRPPGSLSGAGLTLLVGLIMLIMLFPLLSGRSVRGTVEGPVEKVRRGGGGTSSVALVEYRPQDDVAHLCGAEGVCREYLNVPDDAEVGDRRQVRYKLADPTNARTYGWTLFGLPGLMLVEFTGAALAVLIGLLVLGRQLRYRLATRGAHIGG
jgi:hypothetical protein